MNYVIENNQVITVHIKCIHWTLQILYSEMVQIKSKKLILNDLNNKSKSEIIYDRNEFFQQL